MTGSQSAKTGKPPRMLCLGWGFTDYYNFEVINWIWVYSEGSAQFSSSTSSYEFMPQKPHTGRRKRWQN